MLLSVLALVAALLLSQTPQHRLFMQPNLPTSNLAQFEAFPASGTGTSGACSTTAPTGARGETLTATRASSATCQSTAAGGMVSTGISVGDLSILSTNVVRVERDRNGVLGTRVEGARINYTLRSQEIDNAAWTKRTANMIWANDAGAPDGTQTMDALHLAATVTAAGVDGIYQTPGACGGANPAKPSFYAQGARPPDGGVAGSGTFDFTVYNGVAFNCGTCDYVAASISRCTIPTFSAAVGSDYLVGNDSRTGLCPSAVNRSMADVLLWGFSCENGTAITSYTPTTSAAVARALDVVSMPVTLTGSTFSAAVSYDTPSALITGAAAFQVYVDANNSVTATVSAASKLTCTFRIGGVNSTVDSAAAINVSAVNRTACTYGASGRSACLNGTCTTTAGALTMFTGAATFYGGTTQATGAEANGVISRWCYDQSDPRCVL